MFLDSKYLDVSRESSVKISLFTSVYAYRTNLILRTMGCNIVTDEKRFRSHSISNLFFDRHPGFPCELRERGFSPKGSQVHDRALFQLDGVDVGFDYA